VLRKQLIVSNESIDQLGKENNVLKSRLGEVAFIADAASKASASAHSRLNGIALTANSTSQSPSFGCGEEQKAAPNNLTVMYGSKDGTDCSVHNVNFYKTFNLRVPPQ